ncbi:NAD(P)-dependent oxidoreductase [Phytohabitans kaempferiae]|uniref:NAD(P)-dependent oxidoreductase n=1 Tax=Phytohabitans kaempferiae TaxID=1620943 RepID=A0ABV6M4Z8_9ACTN
MSRPAPSPAGLGEVGFLGLGVMGQPMAVNLARAGIPLVAWNRTPSRCEPARAAGARIAPDPGAVFERCEIILTMLADEQAIDAVLGRNDLARLSGRTVVQMGTVAPDYSLALSAAIQAAGGSYVEAPVSGSRGPAEAGELVAMLAGPATSLDRVRPLLRHCCSATFDCGPVPSALVTKLAVNLFLITMVTGLAESFHFAEEHGVDPALLMRILDAGPMASTVSRAKARKLVEKDFDVQASIANVLENNRLIAEAAHTRGVPAPLLDVCHALYGETLSLGHGALDMAAVVHAFGARAAVATGQRHASAKGSR